MNPYSRETKRGDEETVEALNRALSWLGRLQNSTDADVDAMRQELKDERDRVKQRYQITSVEIAIDNFVFNRNEAVEDILSGGLDAKTAAISEIQEQIEEEFGYVQPPDLTKEETLWLVAQEVKCKVDRGSERYTGEPFVSTDLDSQGTRPDLWADEYPIHNR